MLQCRAFRLLDRVNGRKDKETKKGNPFCYKFDLLILNKLPNYQIAELLN